MSDGERSGPRSPMVAGVDLAGVGLCSRCCEARVVVGARSRFLLCRASERIPEMPRYPRLPVLSCAAYSEEGASGG